MRASKFILLLVLITISSLALFSQKKYFGQQPPGDSAVVFAPGIISLEDRYEYCPFMPNDNTFYFCLTNNYWNDCRLWFTKYVDGVWTEQRPISNLEKYDGWTPTISPDGKTFYYSTARLKYPPVNIFKCDIVGDSLTNCNALEAPINSSNSDEWRAVVSDDNTIIFASNRAGGFGLHDLYIAEFDGDTYSEVQNMGIPINSSAMDASPYLAYDKSFLMFESDKAGGYGQSDIYISYKKEDGTWTNPKNMGPTINTPQIDDTPSLTPDKNNILFSRREGWVTSVQTEIYWINSGIIDELKLTNFSPYVKKEIPDSSGTVGEKFIYTIPDNTFIDDDGNETLTLSVQQENGENLPSWLRFNNKKNIFSGTPDKVCSLSIKVTATDTENASVTDVFKITIEN